MAKLRVVARQQVGKGPIAESTSPYRQNPKGEREHTEDSPVKMEVNTIVGGPCKAEISRLAHDKYAQGARYPPWVTVHSMSVCPSGGITPKPKDIVFTKVYVN